MIAVSVWAKVMDDIRSAMMMEMVNFMGRSWPAKQNMRDDLAVRLGERWLCMTPFAKANG